MLECWYATDMLLSMVNNLYNLSKPLITTKQNNKQSIKPLFVISHGIVGKQKN